MKILQDSDDLLVIEDRPWLIGVLMILMAVTFIWAGMMIIDGRSILGGLLMILIGAGVPLLIAGVMVQRVRLTFDRQSRVLSRVRRSILGLTRQEFALDRLAGAVVDASTDSDGTTYRLELQLSDPDERVPFTTYYTSGKRPEALRDAVNAWHRRQGQG